MKNYLLKLYNALFIISPFMIFAGMLQVHFQKFLPYQEYFRGKYFFDFCSVTDIFVGLLIIIFIAICVSGQLKPASRKIPLELLIAIALIFIAGILEIFFQKTYEPILTTKAEYFRTMLLYPIIYVLLIYKTLDQKTINRLLISYILMIIIFCAAALAQYFFNIFPGVNQDFMARLVWPYIDFVTLKWESANWVAFFVTPGLMISFVKVVNAIKARKFSAEFYIFSAALAFSAITIYFVQSYAAYGAIFIAIALYLFRALQFKHFAIALLILALISSVIYEVQKNSMKYRIMTGTKEYRYETSVEARKDIWKMNLQIIKDHPFMGVGLNQYQSYFAQNAAILGHEFNELTIPPHSHNFFISFWLALGLPGFAAMLILIAGAFWRSKFSPALPAIFVLAAIMIHGLADSYYWKQEIAYTVWLIIIFAYLYRDKILVQVK
ncbi:O-antigen ligase family protein [Candidatus Peregrinibacteria bacterium]|nr:O-antigen ligase family protein [Candidatus Peregrinibacteria bacterium]